jgi:hypothetical protein
MGASVMSTKFDPRTTNNRRGRERSISPLYRRISVGGMETDVNVPPENLDQNPETPSEGEDR